MHKAGVEWRRVSYIVQSLCYKYERSEQGLIAHESGANIISALTEIMSAWVYPNNLPLRWNVLILPWRTPEKQAEDFINRQNLSEDDAFALFDQLKPVQPEQFIGPWKGGSVNTNHPTEAKMESLKWAGKDFRSSEDVDPIMSYQEDESRVWNADWGHARVGGDNDNPPLPSWKSMNRMNRTWS